MRSQKKTIGQSRNPVDATPTLSARVRVTTPTLSAVFLASDGFMTGAWSMVMDVVLVSMTTPVHAEHPHAVYSFGYLRIYGRTLYCSGRL